MSKDREPIARLGTHAQSPVVHFAESLACSLELSEQNVEILKVETALRETALQRGEKSGKSLNRTVQPVATIKDNSGVVLPLQFGLRAEGAADGTYATVVTCRRVGAQQIDDLLTMNDGAIVRHSPLVSLNLYPDSQDDPTIRALNEIHTSFAKHFEHMDEVAADEKAQKAQRRKEISKKAGALVASVAMVAGAVSGVKLWLRPETYDDFDDRNLELVTQGEGISPGEEGVPEFSRELYSRTVFSDVYQIPEVSSDDETKSLKKEILPPYVTAYSDGLRLVDISKAEGAEDVIECETVLLEGELNQDTKLFAYTDTAPYPEGSGLINATAEFADDGRSATFCVKDWPKGVSQQQIVFDVKD